MGIPPYPENRPLELADKPLLDDVFQRIQPRISELTFVNRPPTRLSPRLLPGSSRPAVTLSAWANDLRLSHIAPLASVTDCGCRYHYKSGQGDALGTARR